jgi:cytochrome c biogenesis protein CcdA
VAPLGPRDTLAGRPGAGAADPRPARHPARRRDRWWPVAVGLTAGALWFVVFHQRFHQGTLAVGGPHVRPALAAGAAVPAFLLSFTVGSLAIWMPCVLQMVMVFMGARGASPAGFRGRWFFSGYIAAYAGLGVLATALGRALPAAHLVGALQVIGGAALAFIGLYLLGVFRRRLRPCGTAHGFALKTGRLYRLGRFSTGVAFAAYCAGCCGPLLYPLLLVAAASSSFVVGGAVTAGFAIAMALPIGLLGWLGHRALGVARLVADNYALTRRASGAALAVFGVLLAGNHALIYGIELAHRLSI